MKRIATAAVFLFAFRLTAQQIAFTFDDLPAHGDLPPGETRMQVVHSILATLKAQHMPPTYGFINGVKLEEHPDDLAVLKAWRAAGQPLGNHAYTHPSLNDHTPGEYEADILKNEPILRSLMPNDDWHWFRYPFLWEGDTLEKRHAVRGWLEANHYRVAQVSMDFEDYLWNAPYARCVARGDEASIASLRESYLATAATFIPFYRDLSHTLYGRDIAYILLMHLGAFDAKMLPDLIALFRARGFSFVTLPQAEADPLYRDDPDIALRYGGTLEEQTAAARHIKVPPNDKPYKQLQAMCR